MIQPRGRENEIELSVPVEIGGHDLISTGRWKLRAFAGQSIGSSPIDIGVELGGHTVCAIYYDQIGKSITVYVKNAAHIAAVIRQRLTIPPAVGILRVDGGRTAFIVAMRVREYEIDMSVTVHIKAMNDLDLTTGVDIEIVSAVVERPKGKVLKATMDYRR